MFLILLLNDKPLMGEHVNTRWQNIANWSITIFVIDHVHAVRHFGAVPRPFRRMMEDGCRRHVETVASVRPHSAGLRTAVLLGAAEAPDLRGSRSEPPRQADRPGVPPGRALSRGGRHLPRARLGQAHRVHSLGQGHLRSRTTRSSSSRPNGEQLPAVRRPAGLDPAQRAPHGQDHARHGRPAHRGGQRRPPAGFEGTDARSCTSTSRSTASCANGASAA